MSDLIKEELEDIEKEIDRLEDIIKKRDDEHYKLYENNKKRDINKFQEQYQEFLDNRQPEQSQLIVLERRKRFIMPYELNKKYGFGDEMTLEHFINNVKCGGFIDYDGYGYYLKNNMQTNVTIHPSDVKHKNIRYEFDKIIWLNR